MTTNTRVWHGRSSLVSVASAFALYLAFALTGFCTALPGAILPLLLPYWHLSDERAGTLFLLLFLGSCVGSLASKGKPNYLVPLGTAVMMCSCLALAFAHGIAVIVFFAFYGSGFGMMIASITRLRLLQRPSNRVPEVNRLNLLWGMGAFLCPTIATEVVRHSSIRFLMLALTLTFLCLTTWILVVSRHGSETDSTARLTSSRSIRLPFVLALYTFLAVGAEAALGAWIATYSHRLERGFFAPAEATSLFWLGLLTSRVIAGTNSSQRLGDTVLMRTSVILAATGGVVLVTAPDKTVLLLAALLAGLGLGPIFPTLLAYVLPRTASNTIFIIAGITSSLLPWLTGMVSLHASSLRLGMVVPMLATAVMLLLLPLLTRLLEHWRGSDPSVPAV